MSATQGDIDVIITQQALKNIDDAAAKVEGLYISFVNLVGAIENTKNLVDASNNVKSMASNTARLSIEVGKAKTVSTEFTDVIFKQDEAYRQAGDALNKLDKEQLKAIQNAGSYSKASKLLIDNVAGETKAVDNLKGAYKQANAEFKLALENQRNIGLTLGIYSKEYINASKAVKVMRDELKQMNIDIGDRSGNVGNYAKGVKEGIESAVVPAQKLNISIKDIWGGIRKLAYILPGIGIAGIFSLAGEAIMGVVSNLGGLHDEMARVRNIQESFSKAVENSTASLGQEESRLVSLYEKTQDSTLSLKERKAAVDELQKLYPSYLGNIKDEDILTGKAASSINELRDAIISLSLAKAADSEQTRIGGEYLKEVGKITKAQKDLDESVAKAEADAAAFNTEADYTHLIERQEALNKRKKINEDNYQAELMDLQKYIDDYKSKYSKLDYDLAHRSDKGGKATKSTVNKSDLKDAIEIHVKFVKDDLPNFGLSQETIKALGDAYQGMYDEILKDIDDDFNTHDKKRTSNEEAELLNRELLNRESAKREAAERKKIEDAAAKQRIQNMQATVEMAQAIGNAQTVIANSVYEQEIKAIDARDKALKASYDNELRFIEQSGFSTVEKEKRKQKLQAETEARQKQIDHDRITAARKQAQMQKGIDISQTIASTAAAIIGMLKNPGGYPGVALSIAAGITGATQIAKVIATPLPQYYTGRGKTGKSEWAIVGDHPTKGGAHEAIIRGDGSVEITPDRPIKTFLNANDQVLSHDKLIETVMGSTYISLANEKSVTTSKLQAAMLEAYENQTDEIVRLQNILIKKQFGPNGMDMSGYRNYKSMMIKQ